MSILIILAALNFEFLDNFDIFKCEISKIQNLKPPKIVEMAVYDILKSAKIEFTEN